MTSYLDMPVVNLEGRDVVEIMLTGNGFCQVLQLQHIKTINEPDVIANIRSSGVSTTPVLPIGCRIFSSTDVNRPSKKFVIERPPRFVRGYVEYFNRDGDIRDFELKIAAPYQVYVITCNEHGTPGLPNIFWSKGPITSTATKMCLVPLPNHYTYSGDAGRACVGGAFHTDEARRPDGTYDMDAYIRYIDEYVDSSRYNRDLGSAQDYMSVIPRPWREADETGLTEEDHPGITDVFGFSGNGFARAAIRGHLWTAKALNPLVEVLSLTFNEVQELGTYL